MTKLLVGLGGTDEGGINTLEIIDLESAKTCKNLPEFPELPGLGLKVFGGLGFQNMPLICTDLGCISLVRNKWTYSSNASPGYNVYDGAVSLSPYPTKSYKLFLTGGYTTEVLTEHGWKELPQKIPVTISDHCAALVNSITVMVIGGKHHDKYSNKTFFFNTENEIWTEGPQLKQFRNDHSCGTIRKNSQSQEFSVIVAGGAERWHSEILSSVEILDPGSKEWRKGPNLPFGIKNAQMVADQNGGVVLVGGRKGTFPYEKYLDTLFQLPHGGEDTEWFEMEQKLETGRGSHVAFLVPDSLVDCS
jgi:hypothetical protein